jgi:hypothetical protein
VKSTSTKLEIFGTTSDGVGGVRLNAIALNAVSSGGIPGDFDSDGAVDDADLAAWTDNFGATGATLAMGDADDDQDVDGADFLVWQRNLGSGGSAAAIPEPSTVVMIMVAGLILVGSGRSLSIVTSD